MITNLLGLCVVWPNSCSICSWSDMLDTVNVTHFYSSPKRHFQHSESYVTENRGTQLHPLICTFSWLVEMWEVELLASFAASSVNLNLQASVNRRVSKSSQRNTKSSYFQGKAACSWKASSPQNIPIDLHIVPILHMKSFKLRNP